MIQLTPFDSANARRLAAATAIWNAACGPDLAIGQRAMAYNTEPIPGGAQVGVLALLAGAPAGFALASAFHGDPAVTAPEQGWVDAIAVLPAQQRQGAGGALLAWAERWLLGQGCTSFRLGAGLRPFAPGLPSGLRSDRFFANRGYAAQTDSGRVWDMARDLRDYVAPPNVRRGLPCAVRPAQPGDEDMLLAFLAREFPGRWHFECQEHLRGGGRLADYLLLLTEAGVEGFCQLTFEDSLRPLDRFFMHRLPRPWGQLGPIGVGVARRGGGYGAVLLDAGLRHLRAAGVAGCVIDWTDLPDFYGKFGFQRYRQYEMLVKGNAAGRM